MNLIVSAALAGCRAVLLGSATDSSPAHPPTSLAYDQRGR